MTGKKLRTLRVTRSILIVLAVLLLCVSAVSGVLYFRTPDGWEEAEETTAPTAVTEPTVPPTETTVPETVPETTAPTEETWETEAMEVTEEPILPFDDDTPDELPPEPFDNPRPPVDEVPGRGEDPGVQRLAAEAAALPQTEPASEQENLPEQMTLPVPETVPATETVPVQETAAVPETLTEAAEVLLEETMGTEPLPGQDQPSNPWGWVFLVSTGLLVADLIAIAAVSGTIGKLKKEKVGKIPNTLRIRRVPAVGTVHQVGARAEQQDSLGRTPILNNTGYLAVVADGMGGLSNGKMVSAQICTDMVTLVQNVKPGDTQGALRRILAQVNRNVNEALGREGLYRSGSTVVAVLVTGNTFQWISVGDSRIYLYRESYVNQLNQDHDQLQLWMKDILAGSMSYEDAMRHPDGRKLTSFIGMGELRFVDGSLSPIELLPGDRLVLMSDGVYNAMSEERLAKILKENPDVRSAAAAIDAWIRNVNNPHQDNYTAMILGF